MTATSKVREALGSLSPMERETHRVSVFVAELHAEQNELLATQNELLAEQNSLLRRQLEQASTNTITVTNVEPAGTSAGAGRPATGGKPVGKEAPVRLTEPDVPPDDEDETTTGGRPAPTKTAAPATKVAAAAKGPRARGQRGR